MLVGVYAGESKLLLGQRMKISYTILFEVVLMLVCLIVYRGILIPYLRQIPLSYL